MATVEDFIFEKEGAQREILQYLYEFFLSYPAIECKIRYRIPFYYRKSWLCYTNPIKNEGIELVFLRGNELSNAAGILSAKGRKQVMGIELFHKQDIPFTSIEETWAEALLLDEEHPYTHPGKR